MRPTREERANERADATSQLMVCQVQPQTVFQANSRGDAELLLLMDVGQAMKAPPDCVVTDAARSEQDDAAQEPVTVGERISFANVQMACARSRSEARSRTPRTRNRCRAQDQAEGKVEALTCVKGYPMSVTQPCMAHEEGLHHLWLEMQCKERSAWRKHSHVLLVAASVRS